MRCGSSQMDEREWRVERELMADVQLLEADIRSDLETPPRPSIWARDENRSRRCDSGSEYCGLGTSAVSRGQDEPAATAGPPRV